MAEETPKKSTQKWEHIVDIDLMMNVIEEYGGFTGNPAEQILCRAVKRSYEQGYGYTIRAARNRLYLTSRSPSSLLLFSLGKILQSDVLISS